MQAKITQTIPPRVKINSKQRRSEQKVYQKQTQTQAYTALHRASYLRVEIYKQQNKLPKAIALKHTCMDEAILQAEQLI